ncbi:MAG: hypothetical protein AB1491_00345 [Thermodesulfobacteriota bacterium]
MLKFLSRLFLAAFLVAGPVQGKEGQQPYTLKVVAQERGEARVFEVTGGQTAFSSALAEIVRRKYMIISVCPVNREGTTVALLVTVSPVR